MHVFYLPSFYDSPVNFRHLKGAKRFSQYSKISCDLDGILKKVRKITGVHGSDAVNGGYSMMQAKSPSGLILVDKSSSKMCINKKA